MTFFRSIALLVLVGALASASNQQGVLLKMETLRKDPFSDARAVTSLKSGAKVEVLERKGGWYRVSAGRHAGWVRMLSVRTSTKAAAGTASGVAGLASGRTGSGAIVSTTGIRALNEGDLRSAVYNETEVMRLDSFAVTKGEARAFANEAGLSARQLEYLPVPKGTPR